MLLVLLVDASAFMVGVNRIPSARCSSAMVESWYDAKMAADGEAVTAGPPALSPEQAADNPELAKKIAAAHTRNKELDSPDCISSIEH